MTVSKAITENQVGGLSDDELEMSLHAWEAVASYARASQMRLLREVDRRQLNTRDGSRSLAEWAASRLDVSTESSRVLVRTARRLADASEVESDLEAGLVSFDRAVELARAAAGGVDVSGHQAWDIAGLRRRIAHGRRLTRIEEREVHMDRYLALQPSLDNSRMRLHGLLSGEAGHLVASAIDRRADEITPPEEQTTLGARRADALVSLCVDSAGSSSEPLFHVFVDDHGASVEGRTSVGTELLEKVLCTGSVEAADLTAEPLALGRRTRVVSRKLRRAVLHRDLGACVIDGCDSRYRLEAHHVVPWFEGGRTDLDNLATLCWYHHHIVVHGQGRRLDPNSPTQRRRFLKLPP